MAAARRTSHYRRPSVGPLAASVFLATALAAAVTLESASAQSTSPNPYLNWKTQIRPTPAKKTDVMKKDKPMLVQSNEIDYDYNNERVSAVGNVQIYFNGATIEADRVVYDQKAKRLRAEGNARVTEADGKVTYGQLIDLSDDYRDGFVDSLRQETVDQTRLAAARADRTSGSYTVFQSGVYTACEPCKDNPTKPPFWQVKAARIIHDQTEKMMYFEDAQVEFFGVPLAYFPYLATPDPTVKRKSGFLMPVYSTNTYYGFGVATPYYFALAPSYDLTLTPLITTKQGPLLQADWRQRFENGSLNFRIAGIDQLDKSVFIHSDGTTTPGYRDLRGGVETSGKFNLTSNWTWGWDAIKPTDKTFFQDYKIVPLQARNTNLLMEGTSQGATEGVSQLYLAGRGDRSYFDVRTIYYEGFSEFDTQSHLPIIHPVLDYSNVVGQPVLGGELSYNVNLTSLTRQTASYDAINQDAVTNNSCAPATADPAVKIPTNCLLRGVPGTYSRFTAESQWRRQFIDPFGQVFTPFISVRAEAAQATIKNDVGVANYMSTGDAEVGRAMPAAGFLYRYPFIGVQPWGTQTVEPIAQVILRPNEANIRALPNEDAQSLVFDDSNLFKVDKFSGYDRTEGGGRANVGLQYTAQFNRGGMFNVLFGQSYQLFGTNSFAIGDVTNTGLGSGLDKNRSDYVARMTFQPNNTYAFISRFRFDEQDFTVHRLELEARATFDRWSYQLLYGNYDAQPELGFLYRRQGVYGLSAFKLTSNWSVFGGARYDIEVGKISQARVGIGYIDDCFMFGLNYTADFTYSGNASANQTVTLNFGLRTIAGPGATTPR